MLVVQVCELGILNAIIHIIIIQIIDIYIMMGKRMCKIQSYIKWKWKCVFVGGILNNIIHMGQAVIRVEERAEQRVLN